MGRRGLQCPLDGTLLSHVADDLAESAQLPRFIVERGDRYVGEKFGAILAHPPRLFFELPLRTRR